MKFTSFFLSIIILLQLGCKKNDDMNTDTPQPESPAITDDAVKVTATITGTVLDENNNPVASVNVSSGGTNTTTTDAMGNFVFRNVSISAANGFVRVTKTGYFNATRSFVTSAGKNNYVKIQLLKKILTRTLSAAAGGIVTTTDGATISFPANAFITNSGAAYTGTVNIYAKRIDPTAANLPLVIPGDLRGIDSANREYILKSFGMVGAELEDNSGNSLKIAAGKTATVNFPLPASLQASAPQTIPLWHFDEATARWKQEGTATKNGSSYVGQVNKFSFWNADVPGNFIRLNLSLINNANNQPLVNTMVKITSLSTGFSANGFTNDSGYVSGYVLKNENLKLEVISSIFCSSGIVVYSQNIGPYTANTSLGNIPVTLPANQFINFTGALKNCNNQAVTNGYVSLTLANGNSAVAFTDANGIVNLSLLHCGGTQQYSYYVVDLSTGAYSNIATGTAITSATSLGTVSICSGNTLLTDVYIAGFIGKDAVFWKDGVPTFLTNNSSQQYKTANAVKTLVNNNSVYVLYNTDDGSVNGKDTIRLWKDGTVTSIAASYSNPAGGHSAASGLDIYNNDIYICGTEDVINIPSPARVWKNGIMSVLPMDTFDFVTPRAIKVINGDVYVVGSGGKQNPAMSDYWVRPIYWKNGVLNILPHLDGKANALGITSFNGDVYIAGIEGLYGGNIRGAKKGVYWKNGIKTTLFPVGIYTKSGCNSIFVDNNNVYTAGAIGYLSFGGNDYSNATYWNNGNANLLSGNTTVEDIFLDIFVKNNIVCTVGDSYSMYSIGAKHKPLYFQNGKAVPLTGYNNNLDAGATSIFVK